MTCDRRHLLPTAFVACVGLVSADAWAQAAARRPVPTPAPSDVAALSHAVEAVVERVKPGVVRILVTGFATAERPGDALLTTQRASGSGVILDPDGYILTNSHVVSGARRVQVILPTPSGPPAPTSVVKAPGRLVGAVIVGIDEETDLAVLKVDERGLPALPFGDSEALRQGQLVLAIGSPLALENSVSFGVVSAVARQLQPESPMIYVQTDASMNPGNSGGPLVDVEGRVIGINTLILSQAGGSEGLGFAAPSNIARSVFEQIRRTGRVTRAEIGMRAQTITAPLARGLGLPQDWGVIAADVTPQGPAAQAGVGIGDIILTLDGKPLENARQLNVNLYRRPPGSAVTLELLRGGSKVRLVVSVRQRDDDVEGLASMVTPERNVVPRLGILALDLDDKLARMLPTLRARAGVVVAAANGETSSSDPFKAGDVIYAVNTKSVTSIDQLRSALDAIGPGDPVVLQLQRGAELRFVTIPFE
jgi:serine protease Do